MEISLKINIINWEFLQTKRINRNQHSRAQAVRTRLQHRTWDTSVPTSIANLVLGLSPVGTSVKCSWRCDWWPRVAEDGHSMMRERKTRRGSGVKRAAAYSTEEFQKENDRFKTWHYAFKSQRARSSLEVSLLMKPTGRSRVEACVLPKDGQLPSHLSCGV